MKFLIKIVPLPDWLATAWVQLRLALDQAAAPFTKQPRWRTAPDLHVIPGATQYLDTLLKNLPDGSSVRFINLNDNPWAQILIQIPQQRNLDAKN